MVKFSLLTYLWWTNHENWSSGSDVTSIFKKRGNIVNLWLRLQKNKILHNSNKIQTTQLKLYYFSQKLWKKVIICYLFLNLSPTYTDFDVTWAVGAGAPWKMPKNQQIII